MSKKNVGGTAADPNIQFAKLTLSGQSWDLAFCFNAIAECEAATGCNLLNGLEHLANLSAAQLRGLLWASMRIAQPKATLREAGALINLGTIKPITEAMAEAYRLSMPDPLEGDGAAPESQTTESSGSSAGLPPESISD